MMCKEIMLYDANGNAVGSYVKLFGNRFRVYGLQNSFGFSEYILSATEFERVKQKYNIAPKSQTTIFDFI
ncbi:hypothetical protein [Staphylococcus sp. IVB6214]|uniref:hypothetical protein n=1 Tax=Staphylococcus sp. IVB6214 TaxID=2989766 RepID=UPI0021D20200|nr:hypothetical protein [Staphylococcus sp. IVB6214]UXR83205.1 hypothetical protein MUA51_03905 [Staphylococcus sp. IVB6214]